MLKIGDRVKMTKEFKQKLIVNDSKDHVDEFGDCVGVVIGQTDYNNVSSNHRDYDVNKIGPEFDVRWSPTNLRYGYHPDNLEIV